MQLINNQIFYNLENHLDMSSFDSMNDKIALALAKNYTHFRPSGTSQNTLYDQNTESVFKKRDEVYNNAPEGTMSYVDAWFYAKLTGAVTLGTNFVLRGNIGYPKTYSKKHENQYAYIFPYDNQFQFLFDWIDAQGCFNEYGRVLFWINEPCQKTALHRDYPDPIKSNKDPFIWLTGIIPKKLVVLDPDTNEKHYSNTRACVFNTSNPHASEGHPQFTAWSLRIDGSFNKEWAEKAGIAEHFNVT
jgi:hypothetical protein